MTLEDLKTHETLRITPLTYNYGGASGVTLHECPPNGQGITALIALGIVEALEESGAVDLTKLELNSAEWLHTLIEATRLAFADTRALVGCPDVMEKEVVDRLLSKVCARLVGRVCGGGVVADGCGSHLVFAGVPGRACEAV